MLHCAASCSVTLPFVPYVSDFFNTSVFFFDHKRAVQESNYSILQQRHAPRVCHCPMHKELPTFRAGGVAARANASSFGADETNNSNRKTALTPSFFSNNHFSSSLADAEGLGVCYIMLD